MRKKLKIILICTFVIFFMLCLTSCTDKDGFTYLLCSNSIEDILNGDKILYIQVTYRGNESDLVIKNRFWGIPIANVIIHEWDDAAKNVSSITLPKHAKYASLSGCESLTSISVDPNNKYLKSVDGILYSKDGKELVCYPAGKSSSTFDIPEGTETISEWAFRGCTNLKSITLPKSITTMERAFQYCTSLESVKIADGITSISYGAFASCINLKDVNIPDSVTTIERGGFYECTSLECLFIPDSVTTIGYSAFWNSPDLLVFAEAESEPKGWETDHENIYYGCYATTMGITSDGWKWASGADSAYIIKYTGTDTNVIIPDSIEGKPVTHILTGAFEGNTRITDIIIPDTVTTIGRNAFYECRSLENIYFGNGVKNVGSNAFYWCDSLTNVYIKDIGSWCQIEFDLSGATPLYYAKNLYLNGEKVTSVDVPQGVTSIGSYVFYRYDALVSITLPDTVTSIGSCAFYECDSITTVTIPTSVTYIDCFAFYNCSNLTQVFFENTTAWYCVYNENPKTNIPAKALTDPYNAAIFLTTKYGSNSWHRG